MRTQDYLAQISRFESMVKRKMREIQRLDEMICGVQGGSSMDERVQGSSSHDRMAASIGKLVDLQNETNKFVEVYVNQRSHIISQIDALPNKDYYTVLTDKFVDGKSVKEIMIDNDWSKRKTMSIYSNALKNFEDIYGTEYLSSPTLFI